MEPIDELYQEIVNRKYKILQEFHPDWIMGTLANICMLEKMEPTVTNMLLFAGQLESDLYHMRNS